MLGVLLALGLGRGLGEEPAVDGGVQPGGGLGAGLLQAGGQCQALGALGVGEPAGAGRLGLGLLGALGGGGGLGEGPLGLGARAPGRGAIRARRAVPGPPPLGVRPIWHPGAL